MTETRTKTIDKMLMAMAIVYDKDLPDAAIDLYHELLAPYPVELISAACHNCMTNSKWFPRPAEIIEQIRIAQGPQLSIDSRAQGEWRKVLTAVRQRGRSAGAPKFNDPITAHLVATQFNWVHLCEMREDNENWYEKRWCDAFALASELDLDQLRIIMSDDLKKLTGNIG